LVIFADCRGRFNYVVISIFKERKLKDVSSAVQAEVTRVREMIAETKVLLPKGNVNFAFMEMTLDEADRAVREQDTTALVRLLPELKEID